MKIFLKKARVLGFLIVFSVTSIIRFDIFESNTALAAYQIPEFKKHELLVSGDDSESIVFLIVGDGFKEDEQKLFNKKAAQVKDYIINTDPFSEFKDDMNFYSLDVISDESGAADNKRNLKDTYFQCSFNYAYNIERLLAPCNSQAAYTLAEYYVPDFDYILMLVNDERYGGSGGDIAVTSINEYSYEILIHEMGHSIGGLADEYWAGSYYAEEAPNMTQENDPSKVPWSDLIGVNGIGLYPYEEDPAWFHPSEYCKMEYLGQEYHFCDVCARELEIRMEDLKWQTHYIRTYYDLLSMITVSPSRKTLYIGGTTGKSVKISIKLPDILNKVSSFTDTAVNKDNIEVKFTYKSSNLRVASVSNSGTITAKGKGRAVITVKAQLADGIYKLFRINITVTEKTSKR